jgi:hypothetical protein
MANYSNKNLNKNFYNIGFLGIGKYNTNNNIYYDGYQ